jgi:hypothetical protein
MRHHSGLQTSLRPYETVGCTHIGLNCTNWPRALKVRFSATVAKIRRSS